MPFVNTRTSLPSACQQHVRDAAGVEILRALTGEDLARLGNELARHGIGHGGGQLVAYEAPARPSFLLNL